MITFRLRKLFRWHLSLKLTIAMVFTLAHSKAFPAQERSPDCHSIISSVISGGQPKGSSELGESPSELQESIELERFVRWIVQHSRRSNSLLSRQSRNQSHDEQTFKAVRAELTQLYKRYIQAFQAWDKLGQLDHYFFHLKSPESKVAETPAFVRLLVEFDMVPYVRTIAPLELARSQTERQIQDAIASTVHKNDVARIQIMFIIAEIASRKVESAVRRSIQMKLKTYFVMTSEALDRASDSIFELFKHRRSPERRSRLASSISEMLRPLPRLATRSNGSADRVFLDQLVEYLEAAYFEVRILETNPGTAAFTALNEDEQRFVFDQIKAQRSESLITRLQYMSDRVLEISKSLTSLTDFSLNQEHFSDDRVNLSDHDYLQRFERETHFMALDLADLTWPRIVGLFSPRKRIEEERRIHQHRRSRLNLFIREAQARSLLIQHTYTERYFSPASLWMENSAGRYLQPTDHFRLVELNEVQTELSRLKISVAEAHEQLRRIESATHLDELIGTTH